jgi:hypothetical protein
VAPKWLSFAKLVGLGSIPRERRILNSPAEVPYIFFLSNGCLFVLRLLRSRHGVIIIFPLHKEGPIRQYYAMRLLNTRTLELCEFVDRPEENYAILSHTWEDEEVTFADMQRSEATNRKGWSKIKAFCSQALKNGYAYGWMDTCCIDKSSPAELSEAINSMYRWYKEADLCYVYLSDVHSWDSFVKSRWFRRG